MKTHTEQTNPLNNFPVKTNFFTDLFVESSFSIVGFLLLLFLLA